MSKNIVDRCRLVETIMDRLSQASIKGGTEIKERNEKTGDLKWSFLAHGLFSFFGVLYKFRDEPYLWISIGLTNLAAEDKAAVYRDVLVKNEHIGEPFRFALEDDVLTVAMRIPVSMLDPAYIEHLIMTSGEFAGFAFAEVQKRFPRLEPLAVQVAQTQQLVN